MKKSNLVSLIFVGAIGAGAPYAVLNHDVAQAADTENAEAPKVFVEKSEVPKEGAVENKETTVQPKSLPKEAAPSATTTNTTAEVGKEEVHPVENTASASTTAKAEKEANPTGTTPAAPTNEKEGVALRSASTETIEAKPVAEDVDVKKLKDGEYSLGVNTSHYYNDGVSMSGAAINHTAKLFVRDGEYFVNVDFQPIERKMGVAVFRGYLGNLKYYYGDKVGGKKFNEEGVITNDEFKDGKILEFYPADKKDDYFDKYKEKYPDRTAYPKTIEYKVDPTKIAADKKLKTYAQVYVPVMDLFDAGVQNVNVIFDFNTLKVVKLKEEAVVESKYVELNVSGQGSSSVSKAIDKVARLEKVGNEEYLYITYLSKDSRNVPDGEDRNDNGIKNIKYAFSANAKDKITPETKELDKVVLKDGEDERVYILSEAKLNVTGHKDVIVSGNLYTPAMFSVYSGTVTWSEKENLVRDKVVVDAPKLAAIKTFDMLEKKDEEKRPYDITVGGVTYSPYNGVNGDKFKLGRDSSEKIYVEAVFERNSFVATKTRHLKYTLDGSEPTFSSNDAIVKFSNNDKFKPNNHYRIDVDPFSAGAKLDSNNNLTLKVKAFSADGKESSETVTYTLPYDNKESLDKVSTKATIGDKEYEVALNSDGKYYLDTNTDFKVSSISEKALVGSLDNKIAELGLSDATMFKVNIFNKDGSEFAPSYKDGWNLPDGHAIKLSLANYPADDNTFAYVYENGNLRLISSKPEWDKSYNFNISGDEAYFVIAKKDAKVVKKDQLAALKIKVEEVQKALQETTSVGNAKANLETELTRIKNTLSKPYRQNVARLTEHLEKLDKNLKALNSEKGADLGYLQNNAKELVKITESSVLKEVATQSYLDRLATLSAKLSSSLNDEATLAQNLKELRETLNNIEYKYPTQDIDFAIKKFYHPEETSMANNVFENKGKLIFTPTKTYIDINLKTMLFGALHAHLLELDLFKDSLDGTKVPYYIVNRYDDINSQSGGVGNFAKKLLVEVDKDVKESYDVRVPNDGMGTARPEAKLVIATKVERPEVLTDEEKAERERLEREAREKAEREKAERERAEKERLEKERREKEEAARLEKERLEREAREKAERERAEKERLEKEKSEKERFEREKREKAEAERLEKERLEKEAREREAKERAEKERLEREKREKAEAERLEKERLEREAREREARERAEKERLERESREKAEREKAEREARERAEKERLEREAREKAEREKAERERAEKERLEREKREKEEAARLEKERLEREAREREAREKAEREKAERERLEREAREKAEREAAEKFVKENVEKLKEKALENISKEVATLPKEEKEKIEKIIESATGKDTLATTVEGKAVVVALDNSKTQAAKVEVKALSEEKHEEVANLVAEKISKKAEVVDTYDINLLAKDGEVVKQDGTVAATIAVVKNEDEQLKVYYVKDDSTLELIPSIYIDGKLTFFTSHFSTYTIVKEKKDNNDNNSSGRDDNQDNNQGQGDNQNNNQGQGDNQNNNQGRGDNQNNSSQHREDNNSGRNDRRDENNDEQKVSQQNSEVKTNGAENNNTTPTKVKTNALPKTSAQKAVLSFGLFALALVALAGRRKNK